MNYHRREILRGLAQGSVALGAFSHFGSWGQSTSADKFSDFKALVCIDLKGGNDGFNMIVPTGAGSGIESYNAYAEARGGVYSASSNPQGIALPEATGILDLNMADSSKLGIHSAMPEVFGLINQRKAAIVSNVGTLVEPLARDNYIARNVSLPKHLFSHSDQQILWLTPKADETHRVGWAGRMSELLLAKGSISSVVPMNISVSGENVLQASDTSSPLHVGRAGASTIAYAPNTLSPALDCHYSYDQCKAFARQLAHVEVHPLRKAYQKLLNNSISRNQLVAEALRGIDVKDSIFQPFWATYRLTPGNVGGLPSIAAQLLMITRLIKAHDLLGLPRQTFYAKMGGFDSHDNLLSEHRVLLSHLSKAIGVYQEVLTLMNLSGQVTTFTASEFGRTTSSNGNGSDHGWGSHHFVIGDAVDGGKLYGKLPNLSPQDDNEANVGRGRIIPTISTEQYAATLCRWFGLKDSELSTIFPNLKHMNNPSLLAIQGGDVGFMRSS